MRIKQRQQGMALVAVMLIVSIIATVTLAMSIEQNLLIKRVQNSLYVDTVEKYVQGLEHLAAVALENDFKQQKKRADHRAETDWYSKDGRVFPIEQAILLAQLDTPQGRFNLTNLLDLNGQIDLVAMQAFEQLLVILDLPVDIAAVVTDWIDDNATQVANGAESDYYQRLETPYLAADRKLASIEELRQLKDVDAEMFNTLAPHIVVLPARTNLNVNFATVEVFRAYMPYLDETAARALYEETQSDSPFEQIADFKTHSKHGSGQVGWQNIPDIDVASDYFELTSTIELGGIKTKFHSMLLRDNKGHTTLLYRKLGQS